MSFYKSHASRLNKESLDVFRTFADQFQKAAENTGLTNRDLVMISYLQAAIDVQEAWTKTGILSSFSRMSAKRKFNKARENFHLELYFMSSNEISRHKDLVSEALEKTLNVHEEEGLKENSLKIIISKALRQDQRTFMRPEL